MYFIYNTIIACNIHGNDSDVIFWKGKCEIAQCAFTEVEARSFGGAQNSQTEQNGTKLPK